MLSVRRILCTKVRYSANCNCDKTIAYATTPPNRTDHRNYGQWVPEKFLLQEEDVKKYKIDGRVRALSEKIIYSDYLERKSLRFSKGQNTKILTQMSRRMKDKRHKDLMVPAVSVSLKYLTKTEVRANEITGGEQSRHDESSEADELSPERSSQAIHMPYASTDSYESVTDSADQKDADIPELNEEYKDLYEKYLATSGSEDAPCLEQIMNDGPSPTPRPKRKPAETAVNIPPDWMTDYEQYNDFEADGSYESLYGTPNADVPVTSIPCGGCGALLHCQDPALPGYLPSELLENQEDEILRSSLCQRCHFMKHYKIALDVTVSSDEYPALLRQIKGKRAAILLMVDLTDFPCSIWSGIKDIIGAKTPLFVVGNKVDLLPNDGPHFLKNVEASLLRTLCEMGLDKANVKSLMLISAKTGYGVESLINKMHKLWKYKGDVYLIGCTNVGKSSLFNALLRSDYCKVQAADLIHRATVSPWPGTTLNLLKFPILNPVRWRLWMRTQRLIAERAGVAELSEYRTEKFKDTKRLEYASLHGHIGRSFNSRSANQGDGYFGQEALNETGRLGLNENQRIYRNSRWCFDTPGAILPDQVLHFLTTEELLMTLPRHVISPRSFALYEGQSLFLAGLGRLDLIEGPGSVICTVFASSKLPVTICYTEDADELYQELLRSEAFIVPTNDPERLKLFPALESKNFEFAGIGKKESAVDIVLSSAGWIAMTCQNERKFEVRAWTPQGKGIHLRTPALLSKSVSLRGYRIPRSSAFTLGKRAYVKL